MKQFPKLIKNQVVILFSEANTGHILDINFNLAIEDEQQLYMQFDSYAEALEKATLILNTRKDLECVIYGPNRSILKYLEQP